MRGWAPDRVAEAAGARLVAVVPGDAVAPGPLRAVVDSRDIRPGDLFVGLPGATHDGGAFGAAALASGAWGVLVASEHAPDAAQAGTGVVLAAADPLGALQRLATSWRRALACPVIGVTGSVGKTSTKDMLLAMLVAAGRAAVANARNLNTEIGLPLTILGAPPGTDVLVLEMGMRGKGQIAELVRIAEPVVGVITALGPVHLEQMGSMEAIAAEKAALIAGLPSGGTAVLPAGEPLLQPHRRDDVETVTFGPGGDVDEDALATLDLRAGDQALTAAHLRRNACAAVAAARAVGVTPHGRVDVELSELRGQRVHLDRDITIVNDCYNANPMSMRAALDDLAATTSSPPTRRVAVLGDMLELGPQEWEMHAEIGRYAREVAGVDVLVAVGPLSRAYGGDVELDTAQEAAERVPGLLREGDTVLVKASRGVGLELVAEALA